MNDAIAKHMTLQRANREWQDAIASLERVKRKGDTQAINRAQRRVYDANASTDEGRTRGVDLRRASKVDANQREVVAALRGAGASVQLLHAVGEGCPDLLVGIPRRELFARSKGRQQAAQRAEADAAAGNLAPRLARASRGREQPGSSLGSDWGYCNYRQYRVKRMGRGAVGCSTRPRDAEPTCVAPH
jgi:hypothetical protein